VLGDLILEVAVVSDRPVEEGTDVPGSVRLRRGGSAANTAAAFVRLGGRSTFIGAVGRDGAGRRLASALRDADVTVRVSRVDAPSARLLALIDRRGERSFVTERGAADRLQAADVRAGWLRGVSALHLPGYSLYNSPLSDAAQAAAVTARANGAILSVDLSSRLPLLAFGRQAAWKLIGELEPELLFANSTEAAALLRGGNIERLLEIAGTVVVKEGSLGCRVLWRAASDSVEQLAVATTPVQAADTTGAGDAFAAGFLFTLLSAARGGASGTAHSWGAALLRRAALAGHRAAADLIRSPHPELPL
jgi:sugar/nucleoside kinase (ribokinase family)